MQLSAILYTLTISVSLTIATAISGRADPVKWDKKYTIKVFPPCAKGEYTSPVCDDNDMTDHMDDLVISQVIGPDQTSHTTMKDMQKKDPSARRSGEVVLDGPTGDSPKIFQADHEASGYHVVCSISAQDPPAHDIVEWHLFPQHKKTGTGQYETAGIKFVCTQY